jgi:hypothetical protein
MQDWFEQSRTLCASGDTKALGTLMQQNKSRINLDACDSSGFSALGWAVFYGRADVVELLATHGASVNMSSDGKDGKSGSQWHPLWSAALNGKADVVRALIAAGAKVNAVQPLGGPVPTALHAAAREHHSRVVSVLLESGADTTIRNKDGKTAADLAADHNPNLPVSRIFKEFAGKPSAAAGAQASGASWLLVCLSHCDSHVFCYRALFASATVNAIPSRVCLPRCSCRRPQAERARFQRRLNQRACSGSGACVFSLPVTCPALTGFAGCLIACVLA